MNSLTRSRATRNYKPAAVRCHLQSQKRSGIENTKRWACAPKSTRQSRCDQYNHDRVRRRSRLLGNNIHFDQCDHVRIGRKRDSSSMGILVRVHILRRTDYLHRAPQSGVRSALVRTPERRIISRFSRVISKQSIYIYQSHFFWKIYSLGKLHFWWTTKLSLDCFTWFSVKLGQINCSLTCSFENSKWHFI